MKFIGKIEGLLIALWLGSAIFFAAVVAPSAFSVLPTSELAGGVVNRTLTILNLSGVATGVLLILGSFYGSGDLKPVRVWGQRVLLFLFTGCCVAGQLIIGVYLEHIRGLIGKPIDEIAKDDPLKLQFDQWHRYSVWVLLFAMGTALVVYFLGSRKSNPGSPKSSPADIPDFELPDELKM